ncbi:MAG: 7-cyano-7-deazaguanine synthase [Bdellovibrionales bacterium]|nr:7-cyano-7-deazaguanine synthase [Bdellovibrionales bacterium]
MAVVLLSGGLDSALNLALSVIDAHEPTLALTMRYGQKAGAQELKAARALASHYGSEWREVDLGWLGSIHATSLTRSDQAVPEPSVQQLDDAAFCSRSAKAVWVANRNGLFLNVAASFAEALGHRRILAGFNREEAVTFPDNSEAFLEALNRGFSFSTLNGVVAESLTAGMDKREIIASALRIGLPLEKVWSCYGSGPTRCWRCESCRRTERALLAHGESGETALERIREAVL